MMEGILSNFFDIYSKYLIIVLLIAAISAGLYIITIKYIRCRITSEISKVIDNKSISKLEIYKDGELVECMDVNNGGLELDSHLPCGEYIIKEYYLKG